MRILIDDGLSTVVKLTGIGHQAINLYKHLQKLTSCDITDYSYLAKLPRYIRRSTYLFSANLRLLKSRYSIIHYQNYYVPVIQNQSKKIVTIHDLGAFHFSSITPTLYSLYNRISIRKSIQRVNAIIVPSESIKNEIIEMFDYSDASKIFTCDDGIRDVFWKSNSKSEILKKNSIEPFSYFFFLGSLSRRKNLKFILESFIKAKNNNIISKDTFLLLGGQKWWGSSDFKDLFREDLGIKTLGYLEDEDILQLYRNCKAMIFPSLYEGFGMPIIEAMSQNTPIIMSNIATSIELNRRHNNQMFGFNLNDENKFIEQLVLLDKESESIRKSLNYGDLSRYHFDNVAKRHLEVYESILNPL